MIPSQQRKPRLLWANYSCLLDTSSGASISVRQMLLQLYAAGYEIEILGATLFDDEKGLSRLSDHKSTIKQHEVITIKDGPLSHKLLVTESFDRKQMSAKEVSRWHDWYCKLLIRFKPDLVWYYGGNVADFLIAKEARDLGIPVAFYLVNGNYIHSTRWCRDIDLIITDSRATAHYYKQHINITATQVGKFVPKQAYWAPVHNRKNVLFINPSLQKGGGIVAMLACLLEKQRPDIRFEVVESRGHWYEIVKQISAKLSGVAKTQLTNVTVTPNQVDMRSIYSRARVLLAPSLWWESGGRVVVEAMINGIPAIVTDRGGLPECMQKGGVKIQFPAELYEKPYDKLPEAKSLQPMIAVIERLYDDPVYYQTLSKQALQTYADYHSIDNNTQKLIQAFEPLLEKQAGDQELSLMMQRNHKFGLLS